MIRGRCGKNVENVAGGAEDGAGDGADDGAGDGAGDGASVGAGVGADISDNAGEGVVAGSSSRTRSIQSYEATGSAMIAPSTESSLRVVKQPPKVHVSKIFDHSSSKRSHR